MRTNKLFRALRSSFNTWRAAHGAWYSDDLHSALHAPRYALCALLYILCTLFFALCAMLLFSGCTSPLWWYNPETASFYRGFMVVVSSQSVVIKNCGPLALGCLTSRGVLYSVNNPVVLAHECRHIDSLLSGSTFEEEQAKDIISSLLGLESFAVILTSIFPATDCGDGTIAAWQNGKMTVRQQESNGWKILQPVK